MYFDKKQEKYQLNNTHYYTRLKQLGNYTEQLFLTRL